MQLNSLLALNTGGVLCLSGNNRSFDKEQFSLDHSVVCITDRFLKEIPGSVCVEGLLSLNHICNGRIHVLPLFDWNRWITVETSRNKTL